MASKVTNFTTWKAYWQEIASQLPEIKDIVVGNISELEENQTAIKEFPCLWVELPDFDISDRGAENYTSEMTFGIAILDSVEFGDFDGQAAMVENVMDLWRKVLARMVYDRREGQLFQFKLPKTFDMVKPLFANHLQGYRTEFRMNHQIDLEFNPADWTL